MAQRSIRRWLGRAWPFAALCLLVSSRWLLEEAHPEMASTSLTEAVGCLLAAGLASVSILVRPNRRRFSQVVRVSWEVYLAAAATLSGPAIASIISDRHLSGGNLTLTFALTPVVVAVASSVLGETEGDDLTARLWPGLAGIAGLLLLLPQPSLSNWRMDLALVLMPLISGIAAASVTGKLARTKRESDVPGSMLRWNVYAFGFAALAFIGLAARSLQAVRSEFSFSAAVLDGFLAWLNLTVLTDSGAVRWSAQFLIIPLLTMLEGVLLLRPVLDTRSWSAFLLLLVSGGYLLATGSMAVGDVPLPDQR